MRHDRTFPALPAGSRAFPRKRGIRRQGYLVVRASFPAMPRKVVRWDAGFLALHVIERSAPVHRGHEAEYAGHQHHPGVGILAASGLVGHSLMDGFAIGAAFQASSTVAAVVAIAVISHDFADGFNTYTITSLYGNNRRRALTLLASLAPSPARASCGW